ncbi:hypothetical protein HMPREF3038_01679 [Akkermansia sp. KLE1797]|nr:hypothetical protein HMPREF3038_01679 [Akkermansia sp. KLE1797]KXU53880.1 hypothetical protein HMPREF3039_01835 [Akkermansia sp. KLE1798]KZA03063.1 hypothetical protein HMPREF1326_03107 [Akkermansia sp. KLE1605]
MYLFHRCRKAQSGFPHTWIEARKPASVHISIVIPPVITF